MESATDLYAGSDKPRQAVLDSALNRPGPAPAGQTQRMETMEVDEDETLVEDNRAQLRPAQQVERKLVAMLQAAPVLVSQLQKDCRPRLH